MNKTQSSYKITFFGGGGVNELMNNWGKKLLRILVAQQQISLQTTAQAVAMQDSVVEYPLGAAGTSPNWYDSVYTVMGVVLIILSGHRQFLMFTVLICCIAPLWKILGIFLEELWLQKFSWEVLFFTRVDMCDDHDRFSVNYFFHPSAPLMQRSLCVRGGWS